MTNLKIGKNIVSIRAFDVDTHEPTTDAVLEMFGKYASAAAKHYFIVDGDLSRRAYDAVGVSLDIDDFVRTQPYQEF